MGKSLYRAIPGLPAPIRLETPAEASQRRVTYLLETKAARLLLKPGKPKFIKETVNQPR